MTVLETRRSTNIGILMARLKAPWQQVPEAVARLDPALFRSADDVNAVLQVGQRGGGSRWQWADASLPATAGFPNPHAKGCIVCPVVSQVRMPVLPCPAPPRPALPAVRPQRG